MEAIAKAHYVRYAPRKVNQILSLVRGKPVGEAFKILRFLPKKGSVLVAKTLLSACANAGAKELKDSGLRLSQAWIGQGPVLKRMRAHAMGRGATYKRKICHLTMIVTDSK